MNKAAQSQDPRDPSKPLNLHMIGNAHLDPVWLWRWPEGCAEAIGTFWSAVDRLEENPGFVFTRGEALLYDWVRRLEPQLFERVLHFVRQGRWVIVGGWWVQPDCNLPNGESFLRQALYGKSFFAEHLGVTEINVGYNVDSFGHAATLPMLLQHTGLTHYVFMRPMPAALTLPRLFDWLAPNGSSVTAYRIADTYHTSFSPLEDHLQNHLALLESEQLPLMCFYGVGDHGGGPTRQNIARILQGQAQLEPLEFSHPARYFQEVANLPRDEVRLELQQHAIGCYSVIAALKRANRRAEAGLADAESVLALLSIGSSLEPSSIERIGHLWRTLLFNQFHDTLGGTSTVRASQDALEQLTGVIAESETLTAEGVRRLAAQISPRVAPDDAAFVVVNLTGSDFDGLMEYEPWLGWDAITPRRLLDDANNEIPFQDTRPDSRFMGIRQLVWRAQIPSFGYRVYRFAIGTPTAPESRVTANERVLENHRYRLELDPSSGGIKSMRDKLEGHELFPNGAHEAILVEDPTDTWSNGADRFGNSGEVFKLERTEVLETGPLRAVVRTHASAGHSRSETTYILPADPELPLEVQFRVHWHERLKLLRLRYSRHPDSSCRVELPYGSIQREADGRELPGQRWVRFAGDQDVLIATDALSSLALDANDLYFTVLRSPAFSHHEPGTLEESESEFTDQGEHRFRLRILAGRNLENTDAHRLAEHLARTPQIAPQTSRGGTLPHSGRFLHAQTEHATITWLKPAENGDGVIVRVLESEGLGGTLRLEGNQATLQPHSIHSFRLNASGELTATDGLEVNI